MSSFNLDKLRFVVTKTKRNVHELLTEERIVVSFGLPELHKKIPLSKLLRTSDKINACYVLNDDDQSKTSIPCRIPHTPMIVVLFK